MVKHKSKCSLKSTIYFDLDPKIIKENCKFTFYYNKTDITPTVLDGGIPIHPYVLVNRSVLCNSGIEVESNFLLESLAVCHDSKLKIGYIFHGEYSFCQFPGPDRQSGRNS